MTNNALPATLVTSVVWTRTTNKLPELTGLYLTCTKVITIADTETYWNDILYFDGEGWRWPEDIYEEYPEAIDGEILYWAERPKPPIS